MKKSAFLFAFILACNFIAAQDLNYFVKFEGIPGELTNKEYKDWCILESFDQQVLRTDISDRRSVSFEGKTITVVKKIDKASPKIMEALTKGKIIKSVDIRVEAKVNRPDKDIYKYELENVSVTKYNILGKEQKWPMEEIVLKFEALKIRYTWYKNEGEVGGNIETEYK